MKNLDLAMIKKYFPFSFGAATLNDLIFKVVLYLIAGFVVGTLIGLLAAIPVLGIIFSIAGFIVEVYVVLGIVLLVLDYLKILK